LFYSRYWVPSLFPGSSRVPIESPLGLFKRLDDQALSLPDAFELGGFGSVGISAHSWMKPGTEVVALFDEFHDLSSRQTGAYPEAPTVVDEALAVLAARAGQKTFLYLHFMDPHQPYHFDRRARELFGERDEPEDLLSENGSVELPDRALTDVERDFYDALYDGAIRRVDDELRRLADALSAAPEWEGFSLIVTSDHGEHLGEVPGRHHKWTLIHPCKSLFKNAPCYDM
jgi:arylsulfatase A-like enzyme